jgi:hypothetical protein
MKPSKALLALVAVGAAVVAAVRRRPRQPTGSRQWEPAKPIDVTTNGHGKPAELRRPESGRI